MQKDSGHLILIQLTNTTNSAVGVMNLNAIESTVNDE